MSRWKSGAGFIAMVEQTRRDDAYRCITRRIKKDRLAWLEAEAAKVAEAEAEEHQSRSEWAAEREGQRLYEFAEERRQG